jgi:hypothetical protein
MSSANCGGPHFLRYNGPLQDGSQKNSSEWGTVDRRGSGIFPILLLLLPPPMSEPV